jgi:hypothetical protein
MRVKGNGGQSWRCASPTIFFLCLKKIAGISRNLKKKLEKISIQKIST